ncbi:hypothetical protein WOLCODRAFT_77078, partial [Wolfiporia cocos MD-104 SS10]
LLVYDYTLTLVQEIQYVWSNGRRSATIIFVANRCVMISLAVSFFLDLATSSPAYGPVSTSICLITERSCHSHARILSISVLRIYAVPNQSWVLAMLTLVLGVTPLAFNVVRNLHQLLIFLIHRDHYLFCRRSREPQS